MVNRRSVLYCEDDCVTKLSLYIKSTLLDKGYNSDEHDLVIFCVGTDCSTGDSLGPLVGTFLQERGFSNVYGTLDDPVHAMNLDEAIETVFINHDNPFIIAVDAGLGRYNSVGSINVKKGPLSPGAGINRNLTPVGDIHIAGIVNVAGYMEFLTLQCTKLGLVMRMAISIAEAIIKCVTEITMPLEEVSCSKEEESLE